MEAFLARSPVRLGMVRPGKRRPLAHEAVASVPVGTRRGAVPPARRLGADVREPMDLLGEPGQDDRFRVKPAGGQGIGSDLWHGEQCRRSGGRSSSLARA